MRVAFLENDPHDESGGGVSEDIAWLHGTILFYFIFK